jgi:hypothetical protein
MGEGGRCLLFKHNGLRCFGLQATNQVVGSSNLSGRATRTKGYLRVALAFYFRCTNLVPSSVTTRGRARRSAYSVR